MSVAGFLRLIARWRGTPDPDGVGVLHVRPAPTAPTRPRVYVGQTVMLIPLKSEQPNAAPVPVKILKTTREQGTIAWLTPSEFRKLQQAETAAQKARP